MKMKTIFSVLTFILLIALTALTAAANPHYPDPFLYHAPTVEYYEEWVSIPPKAVEIHPPKKIPLIPSFLPSRTAAHPPETCAISTGHGLEQDLDCDKVPDRFDNCVEVFNPSQSDQNKNGIGDACDLIMADFNLAPQKLTCGRAMVATAIIANNQPVPFNSVKATLKIAGINVEATEYIKMIQPGSVQELELTARIPTNAEPGNHNLKFTLEYFLAGHPEKTSISKTIKIGEEGCRAPPSDTFVQVREIEDVRVGEKAVFPIKLINTEQRSNSYIMNVEGVSDFGNYGLDTGSVVIVPGETESTVYLSVWPDEDFNVYGSKPFTLEVRKGNEVEQITLVANILPPLEEDKAGIGGPGFGTIPDLIWYVLLALLLGAIIYLAYVNREEIRDSFRRGAASTRGTMKNPALISARPQPVIETVRSQPEFHPISAGTQVDFDINPEEDDEDYRYKVAKVGLERNPGWFYFIDEHGDISMMKLFADNKNNSNSSV